MNKLLQRRSIQTRVIGQEIQLLQLEVVPVVALSFSLQHLEDGGPEQQVGEVGQTQDCSPVHFDLQQLKPRHQHKHWGSNAEKLRFLLLFFGFKGEEVKK